MRTIHLLACLAPLFPLHAADSAGALAALHALPAKYQNGVLKLSADDANPNPDTWYVVAQKGGDDSNIHNITVSGGHVVSDKRTLGLREIFGQAGAVAADKIAVDSKDAFAVAQKYANANGATVGSVCFALQQSGGSSVPVWSVWCYGPDGSYQGLLKILASNGTVISNNAFPKHP